MISSHLVVVSSVPLLRSFFEIFFVVKTSFFYFFHLFHELYESSFLQLLDGRRHSCLFFYRHHRHIGHVLDLPSFSNIDILSDLWNYEMLLLQLRLVSPYFLSTLTWPQTFTFCPEIPLQSGIWPISLSPHTVNYQRSSSQNPTWIVAWSIALSKTAGPQLWGSSPSQPPHSLGEFSEWYLDCSTCLNPVIQSERWSHCSTS